MNTITITLVGSSKSGRIWANVDIGDQRFHMLNERSLEYFLKKQLGMNSEERGELFAELNDTGKVSVERVAIAS